MKVDRFGRELIREKIFERLEGGLLDDVVFVDEIVDICITEILKMQGAE